MGETKSAEVLEQEILAAADARAEEIVQHAERVVRRIDRQAARRADEIRDLAEADRVARAEAERVRAEALVELEAKRDEAERREALVNEAFASARETLKGWRGRPGGEAVIERLVSEAVDLLPGEVFRVELPPEDAERLGRKGLEEVAERISTALGRAVRLELAAERPDFVGGARVTSADGRQLVDQSFEGRLDRMSGELRASLHRTLFSAERAAGRDGTGGQEADQR